MGMNDILTVKEVATLLKTTCQQVRKMIQNGELPAVKVGREWRISSSCLLEFFDGNIYTGERNNVPLRRGDVPNYVRTPPTPKSASYGHTFLRFV